MAEGQGHVPVTAHTHKYMHTHTAQAKKPYCKHAMKKQLNIYLIARGEGHSSYESYENPKGNNDSPDHVKMLNLRRTWDKNTKI